MNQAIEVWKDGRYERKTVVEDQYLDHLRRWAYDSRLGFRPAFPDRTVQSLYFDSHSLDDLDDGLSGASSRRKVRLRWYGEDSDATAATLEVKCKHNELGIKLSHPIALPAPLNEIELESLSRIIARQLPAEIAPHCESSSVPTIQLRYRREYMVSADGRVRVTFDRDIRVYDQLGCSRLNSRRASPFPEIVVMEVKYAAEDNEEVLTRLEHLPTRMTRLSKYSIGQQVLLGV